MKAKNLSFPSFPFLNFLQKRENNEDLKRAYLKSALLRWHGLVGVLEFNHEILQDGSQDFLDHSVEQGFSATFQK